MPASYIPESKAHYELLDGLRGVAALLVIWFHFFEVFATSAVDQVFNHGYLAVDFFFVLSGFVLSYAYDDRWKNGLTVQQFILRRVIRLHPMVLIGVLFGVCSFLFQGSVTWNNEHVGLIAVASSALLSLFLVPTLPNVMTEIRGGGEMYPLNGPLWTLFFEYIASFCYALLLRRLSTKKIGILACILGIALAFAAVGNMSGSYNLGIGWTLRDCTFIGGILRAAFSFTVGMLVARTFRPAKIRGAFWLCTLGLIAVTTIPYVGAPEVSVLNGVYESVCVIFVFPLIVWLGASGKTTDALSSNVCNFLGKISYPIYLIHYPAIYYLFYLEINQHVTFSDIWSGIVAMFFGFILVAWLVQKVYDMPVRRFLTKKFVGNSWSN